MINNQPAVAGRQRQVLGVGAVLPRSAGSSSTGRWRRCLLRAPRGRGRPGSRSGSGQLLPPWHRRRTSVVVFVRSFLTILIGFLRVENIFKVKKEMQLCYNPDVYNGEELL